MVLAAYFVLSLVSRALLPPSSAQCVRHCRQLDASVGASGPHDFAVRGITVLTKISDGHESRRSSSEGGKAPFVFRHLRGHRIPRSTFVTIAIRPSDEAGRPESVMLCLANGEAKYFFRKGWTAIRASAPICPGGQLNLHDKRMHPPYPAQRCAASIVVTSPVG
jgi:hypothetical protein